MKALHLIIIAAIMFVAPSGKAGATDRDDVEAIIVKAESIMTDIENNSAMKKYVPFDTFSEALLYIIYAREQLEEKAYNASYFYATMSIIKFEITSVLAQANKYDYDLLIKERDYCRGLGAGGKMLTEKMDALLNANLEKIGGVYRAQYLEKYIFTAKTGITDQGRQRLDRIIRVLQLNPSSKATIVSHSAEHDGAGLTQKKSDSVKKYFISKGINADRLESIGLGSREVMETNLGYRKINRLEIIMKGLEY